ncbi:MAG: EAL domain-containing protein [Oscillospiraceae bacterium]|nr:EAL domain-containing protein [Oscillospiraceae bacterium]
MDKKKRIALFVGQADEAYQNRFISGFLKTAFSSGFDVCIFSMYRKYQDTAEREQGESNIFSLMNPAQFDGAVILKDSIQTEHATEKLEQHLKKVFDKPIVVIEKESELFPSICTDCYSAEYELVSHLIEHHGCRDIAFVSGKKWHKHSKERLQGYLDAMKAHDLPVAEQRILYGDFWYQSGGLCAEQLLSQHGKLPDAVACANDQMAIGLCKVFEEHDIRVPEDILVVGYDSTYEGQTSPRSLTSAWIPAEEFGEYAFRFLQAEMRGEMPDSFKLKPHLLFGESCGCQESDMPHYCIRRETWGTDISEEGYSSVFNMMDENLIMQTSLPEFLNTVYSYVYQLKGIGEFHLCIASDWQYVGQSIHVPNEGYPEQMIHAIRYYSDHRNNTAGFDQKFSSSEMLPDLYADSDRPTAWFFTPLFFETECFGYSVVRYAEATQCYDETYRRWIGSVCRGFEVLRRNLVLKQMQEHLERIRNSKFSVSNHAYESLNQEEKAEYQLVSTILDENLLEYHFQPIVSTVDGEIFAYEALMRSKTEKRISPLNIIKYAAMQERLSDVESATFLNVLRVLEKNEETFGDARVFINSIPGVRMAESAFSEMSVLLKKYSRKVVVELTEEAELQDADLKAMKAFFAKQQIDIAVDDYGTGYSNVSNLLRYMPNYVKIDRSLLSGIENQMQKQHFVREIIDFCHDNHILALAEGVETAEELQTVIHLGADLIQGFYTARPSAVISAQIDEKRRNEIRQYYQERIDGTVKKIYIAGKTSRVSLARLMKDGCTDIVVGQEGMIYKDIAIISAPQMKSEIHLRVEAGYSGRIALEDAWFSNVKNRPCIELGEYCDVTLVLYGTNTLYGSGIQVPESSRLCIEGDGALNIELNASDFYGIGNHQNARHGELVFEQDGPININSRGQKGVCIGSGLGGEIHINRGEFNLNSKTETCVGIGSLNGEVSLALDCCHIEADFSVSSGLLIGSMENTADVSVRKSAVNYYASGKYICGIGSLRGKKAAVRVVEAGLDFNMRSDYLTGLGTLYGESDIRFESITLSIVGTGPQALAFGGYEPCVSIYVLNSDQRVKINNALGKETLAPPEKIQLVNGRHLFRLNGKEIEHPIRWEY